MKKEISLVTFTYANGLPGRVGGAPLETMLSEKKGMED